MKITDVRAITCDVPLPRPIILGDIRYQSRDYVIVEIRTDEGISGVGFGMGRYAPVAEVVERNLKPLLIGQDPLMTEHLWDRLYYLNLIIGQRGIFMRALSAVDVALWDVKGKVAGLPIWRLLGGYRRRVPILMAGGYVAADKTPDDLAREVADYVERGFTMVKIAAGELEEDTVRLRASRAAAGPHTKLMHDVHMAWRDPSAVAKTVRSWEELDLGWIEDPFPSELQHLTTRLREHTAIPLAIGEDLVGRWAFRDLFQRHVADIVRIDVTTVGGFTEALKICALAAVEGIPVSPHVFPEIHLHLGAALPGVMSVEMSDPAQGVEGMHLLLATTMEVDHGVAIAPERPGLGFEIAWSAVERYRR